MICELIFIVIDSENLLDGSKFDSRELCIDNASGNCQGSTFEGNVRSVRADHWTFCILCVVLIVVEVCRRDKRSRGDAHEPDSAAKRTKHTAVEGDGDCGPACSSTSASAISRSDVSVDCLR